MKKRAKKENKEGWQQSFEKSHCLKCWPERSERHKTERELVRKRQRASRAVTPTQEPKEKEPWGGTYWIHLRSKSCTRRKLPLGIHMSWILGQYCNLERKKKTTTSKTKHRNKHTNTSPLKDWELERDWPFKIHVYSPTPFPIFSDPRKLIQGLLPFAMLTVPWGHRRAQAQRGFRKTLPGVLCPPGVREAGPCGYVKIASTSWGPHTLCLLSYPPHSLSSHSRLQDWLRIMH